MKEINIKLNSGINNVALCFGNPDNPPLLAFHGWLDNANSFLPLAPYLKNYYLIALDITGHGKSDHYPKANTYHFIDSVPYGFSVMDALGYEKVSLLGHSMGAAITTLMAGTMPERVNKLLLIEGLGPLAAPANSAMTQSRDYMEKLQWLNKKQEKVYKDLELAVDLRAHNSQMSLASARLIVERAMEKVDGGYKWRHDPRLLFPTIMKLTEDQVYTYIENICAPTILIEADNGYPYGNKLMKQRMRRVKHLNHQLIPGGHHLHMDIPEVVAKFLI